jgi:hypothetical protein
MRDSSLLTRGLRNLVALSWRHMKKKSRDEEVDDLRLEYDLRELLKSEHGDALQNESIVIVSEGRIRVRELSLR